MRTPKQDKYLKVNISIDIQIRTEVHKYFPLIRYMRAVFQVRYQKDMNLWIYLSPTIMYYYNFQFDNLIEMTVIDDLGLTH